ncbi:copper amine oxidase N-terminal domain-containing protein [Paenibacillus sp. 7124]|uniref:Copper amine oxidase N-terminal domain-containing protein n=1 Tax=Paenibacillus apii TaxID=1850370 RepID=A0A6M1PJ68_9BACL|nr:copper amine oxidase N-terminal domain-containing protein [Paenibacillus apii]NGM83246.1 copper amine oxidase N-terminal domain-containing protein [Paenibacillus apii]NJJ38892.1 copper amine oxidase N-terminal domain-containing protein [Paenibacillus apii]
MKKSWIILLTCMLVTSLTAGSALAKPDHSSGNGQSQKNAASDKGPSDKAEGKSESKENKKKSVTDATYQETATTSTYKGHNGYNGLLKAIENVEDKPAGAVLAELLLTNYSTELTPEMKARLEAIKAKDAALTAVAEMLEQNGSVTDAVYVRQEVIKANVKNLDSYKKLGKLYDKLGKKGIRLYVNGEQPDAGSAPVLQGGTTLVPFRAIAEELGAKVTWNKQKQSVTITRGGIAVKLVIGSKTAYVNGKKVALQTAPAVVNGTTVVPVRFVSESLKATVKWEAASRSVVIYEE